MRPFVEGGEYWLYVPKPWNGRKNYGVPQGNIRAYKCKRLVNLIDKLASVKKRYRGSSQLVQNYSRGQSLFILPKTLSKGIHHWNLYESRFKQWLEDIKKPARTTLHTPELNEPSLNELSLLSHSYEEDPLRGFYTIWYSNTRKVPKRRLSTSEKVFEYIDSVWKSHEVERSLSKAPKGGVVGRIDDPSSLSARAKDTLQRWSRVVSHYDVGNESGEDEDPVEMWNRAVETSMLNSSTLSSESSSRLSQEQKQTSESGLDHEIEQSPLSTSTAVRPKGNSRRKSADCSLDSETSKETCEYNTNECPNAGISVNNSKHTMFESTPIMPPRKKLRLQSENHSYLKDLSKEHNSAVLSKTTPSPNRRRPSRIKVENLAKNTPSSTRACLRKKEDPVSISSSPDQDEQISASEGKRRDENLLVQAVTKSARHSSSNLVEKTSKVYTPLRTPLIAVSAPNATSKSASSSLRRRALLNSAIGSARSAGDPSTTPLRSDVPYKTEAAKSGKETPRARKNSGSDEGPSTSLGRSKRKEVGGCETPKVDVASKLASPSRRTSPRTTLKCL